MNPSRVKPVTDVKRHATEIIAGLRRRPGAVLVTERGRSAAVLVDVGTYDALLRRLEVLEAIARGERAAEGGRVTSHENAKRRLARWLADDARG
jgi:prevent-host-death family protein